MIPSRFGKMEMRRYELPHRSHRPAWGPPGVGRGMAISTTMTLHDILTRLYSPICSFTHIPHITRAGMAQGPKTDTLIVSPVSSGILWQQHPFPTLFSRIPSLVSGGWWHLGIPFESFFDLNSDYFVQSSKIGIDIRTEYMDNRQCSHPNLP